MTSENSQHISAQRRAEKRPNQLQQTKDLCGCAGVLNCSTNVPVCKYEADLLNKIHFQLDEVPLLIFSIVSGLVSRRAATNAYSVCLFF